MSVRSVTTDYGGTVAPPKHEEHRARTRLRGTPGGGRPKLEPDAELRLALQRRAGTNLRWHIRRGAMRVGVLAAADVGVFWLLRTLIRAVRDGAALGAAPAAFFSDVIPRGYLSGVQYGVALLIGLFVTGNYRAGDGRRDPGRLMAGVALATALPMWMDIWSRGLTAFALQYSATVFMLWLAIMIERLTINKVVATAWPPNNRAAPTLFVGSARAARAAMRSPALGLAHDVRNVGYVSSDAVAAPDALGHVTDFARLLNDSSAEVVVVCGDLADDRLHDVMDSAFAAGCQVFAVPKTLARLHATPSVIWRDGQPLLQLTQPALHARQLLLKRLLDVVVSSVLLAVLSPVFFLVGLCVKLDSSGPVFFRQRRLGLNGRIFGCVKFRSMHADAEIRLRRDAGLYERYVRSNYKLPENEDPRLTKVGRVLRALSLDELPQLLNVLKGDMSLVGPRPIVPEELAEYGRSAPLFLSMKPGMTGAWAVNGRSNIGYPDRVELELAYVRSWSLFGDIGILLRTIPVVLRRRGAH